MNSVILTTPHTHPYPSRIWDIDTEECYKKEGFNENENSFLRRNGYSWDLAVVFKWGKIEEKSTKSKINSICASGLHVECQVYSRNPKTSFDFIIRRIWKKHENLTYLICKIRAPLHRLQVFADITNRKILLNEAEIEKRIKREESKKSKRICKEKMDREFQYFRPFQYIYGKYDCGNLNRKKSSEADHDIDRSKQALYHLNRKDSLEADHFGISNPFRSTIRIDFILDILRTELKSEKIIIDYYPLHNDKSLETLKMKWLNCTFCPWNQPLEHIKNYLGEEIGFYFAFMGHYSWWLSLSAGIGVPLAVGTYAMGLVDSYLTAVFGFLVAPWGVMMLESWKRNQALLALEWGMLGIEEKKHSRPEFKGIVVDSWIGDDLYFPRRKKKIRIAQTHSVVIICIVTVIGFVAGVYGLRYTLEFTDDAPSWGASYGGSLCSALNSLQILILNSLYKFIAVKLNKHENHRTDIEYQDAMITKLFLFQFVNSYASFFYIAFLQTWILGTETQTGIMYELMVNLVVVFGIQIIVSNISEVLVPYATHRFKEHLYLKDLKICPVERQFYMEKYDAILGTISDFSEIAIKYGFAVLFVSAFPFAPLLGLISNWIEIRTDAYKFLNVYQRPQPVTAQDIGTWEVILQLMNIFSAITNCALICFVMDGIFSGDVSQDTRKMIFIISQAILFSAGYLVHLCCNGVPEFVSYQQKRAEVIEKKFIKEELDFMENPFPKGELKKMLQDRKHRVKIILAGNNGKKKAEKMMFV